MWKLFKKIIGKDTEDLPLSVSSETFSKPNTNKHLNSKKTTSILSDESLLDYVPRTSKSLNTKNQLGNTKSKETLLENIQNKNFKKTSDYNDIFEKIVKVNIIEDLFLSLQKDFKTAFLAGVMYRVNDSSIVYNLNFQKFQIELQIELYTNIKDAFAKSDMNNLIEYYVLDLKQNKVVLVLAFIKHYVILVFDKKEIKTGYILSIIKPQVTNAYYEYVK